MNPSDFTNEKFTCREDLPPAFEVLKHIEEIWDAKTRQFLGYRDVISWAEGRRYGEAGEEKVTLTKSLVVTVGYKTKLIAASAARPVEIFTRLQYLCGRLIKDIHAK